MTRRVRGAVLLGAVAVLAACGGDTTMPGQRPASTTPSTTARTGGGSVNIGIICSTPSDAARSFVDAWMAGDRAAAGRCGSPAAVATLFGGTTPRAAWTFRGCAGARCSFSYPRGTARLRVRGSNAAGWIVDAAQLGR